MTDRWQFTPNPGCWGWGYETDRSKQPNINLDRGEYYDPTQVSLPGGGILRLSAKKLPALYSCYDGNTLRTFKWKSGMIQTKKGWDDPSDDYVGDWDAGFRYGMFEARIKLPSAKQSFPAFWLYSGPTEIDILEAGKLDEITNNLQDYVLGDQHGSSVGCQKIYNNFSNKNVSTEFHIFSCVWTPTKVTFFLDNREIRTIDSSLIKTYPFNCNIICGLQMWPWFSEDTSMDIDYIRVYRPKNGNYLLSYKSNSDFMHTNVNENPIKIIPIPAKVSSFQSSITSNPNNSNEIFYRGSTDNRIYKSELSKGIWSTTIVPFNYNAAIPNSLVNGNGNVVYNPVHNYILYAGKDNRIQYFTNAQSNNSHWFIDDNFNSKLNLISNEQGAMDVMVDGSIAYRGVDDKIHIFTFNIKKQKWEPLLINHRYGYCSGLPDADYVDGDVVVEKSTNNIIYRGRDGRMQVFYQIIPSVYEHAWIDGNFNSTGFPVSKNPGSIISTDNGFFYRGTDDKLHRYYWNGTAMVHQIASNYTYGNCAGLPDADYIKGNLSYIKQFNFVLYIGRDGRIQRFQIPSGDISSQWSHYWIDDYWNTFDFLSFGSTAPIINFGSLVTSTDGKMIYNNSITDNDGNLAYFKFEPCEILNPACSTTKVHIRDANLPITDNTDSAINELQIYPNPIENEIKFTHNPNIKLNRYVLLTLEGKEVSSGDIDEITNTIDLDNLNPGIYIIRFFDGLVWYSSKVVKQ